MCYERRNVMTAIYLSEATEAQIKTYCLDLVKVYPNFEKNIQSVMEFIEDKFEHFKDCITDEKYSEALKYEMSEEELSFIRKKVNKAFLMFTNEVKRFLEETQDKSYATQDYYLDVKELNQKAIEYRKEVRKKLGDYKRMKDILYKEITNQFPDYSFSQFERYKHWVRMDGTKIR